MHGLSLVVTSGDRRAFPLGVRCDAIHLGQLAIWAPLTPRHGHGRGGEGPHQSTF